MSGLQAVCCDRAHIWEPKSIEDRDKVKHIQVVKVQVQDCVAQDHSTSGHAVARMHKVVKSGEFLLAEELLIDGTELKKFYAKLCAYYLMKCWKPV